ncbi:hypothetical protein GOQ27_09095 [Clostridium sp. D2Q-11]|uniref:Uncharacterized protein n=1 Tax=Anaeromonas frigoriresistens TaxID=2683708 RepID=A0A942USW5_9FIRM|nr:hypothetical protein [Anaeromonas frigoriresistens]MBS4538619.1 hypothetical protein [Anaeromonas frigoriresistens]
MKIVNKTIKWIITIMIYFLSMFLIIRIINGVKPKILVGIAIGLVGGLDTFILDKLGLLPFRRQEVDNG